MLGFDFQSILNNLAATALGGGASLLLYLFWPLISKEKEPLPPVVYVVTTFAPLLLFLLFGAMFHLSPDPLNQLSALGFKPDEESFARSIKLGRTDVTSLILDTGVSPLQPLDNMAIGRPLTAPHLAIEYDVPNLCKLFDLLKEHKVDLATPEASGFSAPVTLLDIAIAWRNEEAVRCLRVSYSNLTDYRNALKIKIAVMKQIDIPAPQDRKLVSDVIHDCSKIKFLISRPDAFSEIVAFGDDNWTNSMVSSVCLFSRIIDLKYLVSTVPVERWSVFARGDYSSQNISLLVPIQSTERILKSLE